MAPADAFDETVVAAALAAMAASGAAALTLQSSSPAISLPEMPGPSATSSGGIVVRGLVHRYPGGLEAVRGIDLTIAPGERVAIVGQNGSGKTTLVKHLNGLLGASSGSVSIDGRDVAGIPVSTLAQTVGFVFQNPDDQLFERSVEREVAFGPRNLRLDAAQAARRVERSLAIVDLAAERATNPYDLGPSRRKLVALASVLALEPAVLVLDEPTAGQDWPGVARVGAIVEAWAEVGRTVVAITHDMEFAARHFGRIVVMREGLVALDGPPEEVFAPEHAALLASTGLTPPPVARIAALLGLARMPTTPRRCWPPWGRALDVCVCSLSGHSRRARPLKTRASASRLPRTIRTRANRSTSSAHRTKPTAVRLRPSARPASVSTPGRDRPLSEHGPAPAPESQPDITLDRLARFGYKGVMKTATISEARTVSVRCSTRSRPARASSSRTAAFRWPHLGRWPSSTIRQDGSSVCSGPGFCVSAPANRRSICSASRVPSSPTG